MGLARDFDEGFESWIAHGVEAASLEDTHRRSRRIAAISRGLRRPWRTAMTQSGLTSGA